MVRTSVVVLVVLVAWQMLAQVTHTGRRVRRRAARIGWRIREVAVARSRLCNRADRWARRLPALPGYDKRLRVGPVTLTVLYSTFALLPTVWASRDHVLDPDIWFAVLLPGKRGLAICRSGT